MRGRVDWPVDRARHLPDPFAPEVLASIAATVAGTLSAAEADEVSAVLARVRAVEQALGQGPDSFGLIHADLHQYNLLYAANTVRALDFDDCGFGPLLYDHAVVLYMVQDKANYPALRAALLAGYRQVRPLSVAHEAYIDTFIALRRVQDAVWVLEAGRHPAIGEDWAAQARANLAPLADFLKSEF
jgi:Ser/Thr protein kinase RdoA (MazF antagonist)